MIPAQWVRVRVRIRGKLTFRKEKFGTQAGKDMCMCGILGKDYVMEG